MALTQCPKSEVYSTNEVKTDNYWIDGSPIYRKVIELGTLPNSGQKLVNHGISNLDKIVSAQGTAYATGVIMPIPNVAVGTQATDLQAQVNLFFPNLTQVRIITGTDRSGYTGYLILEYTKSS